jgi:Fe-S-cluster-containing dehydrogenase component
MFSDEQKVRCHCGQAIVRDEIPSCISWCPAAERCLGDVIDLREVRKRVEELRRKASESGYVERIKDEIDRSRGGGGKKE